MVLTKRDIILNDAGFDYTQAAVRQKINRGRFDFSFVLQILDVLKYKMNIENSVVN